MSGGLCLYSIRIAPQSRFHLISFADRQHSRSSEAWMRRCGTAHPIKMASTATVYGSGQRITESTETCGSYYPRVLNHRGVPPYTPLPRLEYPADSMFKMGFKDLSESPVRGRPRLIPLSPA